MRPSRLGLVVVVPCLCIAALFAVPRPGPARGRVDFAHVPDALPSGEEPAEVKAWREPPPVAVEKPIIVLEEVLVTRDVPSGTDLSHLANRQLDSTSVVDAYGVGGGAAGAYGQRWGKKSRIVHGGGVAAPAGPALPPPLALPEPEGLARGSEAAVAGAANPADDAIPAGFTAAAGDGLRSTFAIDVDTASYALVRQHLLRNSLPDPSTVRIEELVNYFPTEDAAPAADDACPLALRAEVAGAPWADGRRLVRVALKARDVAVRPASNLVFLVDVSGSMHRPNRLPLVKRALELLVRQLGENDRVALVVYAGASGLVLPSTSCEDPRPVLAALEKLEAGGSTNGGAGIELAYRLAVDRFVAGGTNRVVLCTDGDWNVGATDRGALEELIAAKAKTGVYLTVLGFDMDGKTDGTMERLADRGNGQYAFVDSLAEARRVLVEQLTGTLCTVAKDVKVQLEWDPEAVLGWRLVGYENRRLANHEFRDDAKDAGEVGAGHAVTALYEVVPRESGSRALGALRMRWKEPAGRPDEPAREKEIAVSDEGRAFAEGSGDLRFATAVAAFGLLLRGEGPGSATLADAKEWAQSAMGKDPGGLKKELVELIGKAEKLSLPGRPDAGPATAAAVARALSSLAETQSPDGSWADETGRPLGSTSLATMAFLGEGHTHRFGRHKRKVNRAIQWLKARRCHSSLEGDTRPEALEDHALAAFALAECYGMSRDFTLKRPVEEALEDCLSRQHQDGALGPDPVGATARTAWLLLALRAARIAGLQVPVDAQSRATGWLERQPRDPLRPGEGRAEALLSVLARLHGDAAIAKRLRGELTSLPPCAPEDDPLVWYAGTQAAWQLGGSVWASWRPALQGAPDPEPAVVPTRRGAPGGRAASAALRALALQVDCRCWRQGG